MKSEYKKELLKISEEISKQKLIVDNMSVINIGGQELSERIRLDSLFRVESSILSSLYTKYRTLLFKINDNLII
jgi:hypothetical protein